MGKLAIALAALALAGCVGTDSMMLDQRTAFISGRGNAFAKPSQVWQKVLTQAATMASERGYSHFAILDAKDGTSYGAYYQPGSSTTNTIGSATCTGYSCIGSATSNTSYTPGYAIPLSYPGTDLTVRFFHANEVDPSASGVWEAATILATRD
jgi:hypothetical protein